MANNYTKTMRQALQEAREYRDTTEGGPGSGPQKGGKKFSSSEIKKAYGILNDPRYKQGNYTGAAKAINKLAPGLADHPDVKNAMKRANENLDLPATGDTTTSNASQEVETVEEESTDEMFSTRSLGLKGASKRSRDKAREKDKDSEKSKKKEDLDEARFTPAQISALQKAYAPLKGKTDYKSATGSKMNFNKLKNKMKSYSVSHLQQLSVADIPMVSDAAKELLARDKRFAEETELDEATRLRPTKGLFTLAQMKQQVARTEKAFNEFEQHCNFIFQMDRDVGPAFSDNSGKYFEVHRALDDANKQIKKALADAKKIT